MDGSLHERTSPTNADLALARIAHGWTPRVVAALARHGSMRYNEVRARVAGIPQRSLTSALRSLEELGFVSCTRYRIFPPRSDYALTPLGQELALQLQRTHGWLESREAAIQAARAVFRPKPR